MTGSKTTIIGGLRAEIWNYTFPFATLTVSHDILKIGILGFKKFSFRPDQIIGFKKRRGGYQIYHNVEEYPALVIFWGNPDKISAAVQSAGFVPTAQGELDDDDEYQLHRYLHIVGFSFLIFIIVLGVTLMILSK